MYLCVCVVKGHRSIRTESVLTVDMCVHRVNKDDTFTRVFIFMYVCMYAAACCSKFLHISFF